MNPKPLVESELDRLGELLARHSDQGGINLEAVDVQGELTVQSIAVGQTPDPAACTGGGDFCVAMTTGVEPATQNLTQNLTDTEPDTPTQPDRA